MDPYKIMAQARQVNGDLVAETIPEPVKAVKQNNFMVDDGDAAAGENDSTAAASVSHASQSTIATVADEKVKSKADLLREQPADSLAAREDGKKEEKNLLFHPPAAHEEHSAGDSV